MRESDFNNEHQPRAEAVSSNAGPLNAGFGDLAQVEQVCAEFELRLVLAALRVGLAREDQSDGIIDHANERFDRQRPRRARRRTTRR